MALCFLLCLVLVNAFVDLASENAQTKLRSSSADLQHPPASAPYNNEKPYNPEAPTIRRIGKHQSKIFKTFGSAPASSPFHAPHTENNFHPTDDHTAAATELNNGENVSVEGQAIHLQKHHHSMDKSVAGGGVILGGLATNFLAVVFCYIRATGRHKSETHQSTTEITK